jgi:transcriptional regulator with XRE-family HTH domain
LLPTKTYKYPQAIISRSMSKMRRVSDFANRLKEYIEIHNMTYAVLSNLTGENSQTLNRYVLGQRIPKIDSAIRIAEALGVSPMWLQGYDEPMYCSTHHNEKLNESERKLINEFRKLNAEGQEASIDYIKYLTTLIKYKKCNSSKFSDSKET